MGAMTAGHTGAELAVRPRESAGGSGRAHGEPAGERRAGGGGAESPARDRAHAPSPAASRRGGTEGALERLRLRFCISLHTAVRADVRRALQGFDDDGSGTISLQNFQLASQQPPLKDWSVMMAHPHPRLHARPCVCLLTWRCARTPAPVSDARPLLPRFLCSPLSVC